MTTLADLRTPFVRCERVDAAAPTGSLLLRGFDLLLQSDELAVLVGPAGAGKSLLLRLLAGLERPIEGSVAGGGLQLEGASHAELARHRRWTVGLLRHDAPNLLPDLTVAENIELPLLLAGRTRQHATERARDLVQTIGLPHAAGARPARLEPGAARRASLAVALANEPPLLLLDEPTAGLDPADAAELLDLIEELHRDRGGAVLIATRAAEIGQRFRRSFLLRNGRITREVARYVAFSQGEGERLEDYVAVDGDGRIELPADARAALGIGRRARITVEDDRVEIRPERPPPSDEPPWRRGADRAGQ